MSNAVRILRRLDDLLDQPVDLTLYGRAALLLGFPNPKPEHALSLDVDAVLWLGQAEELQRNGNFWSALDQVNREFEADGLYMSHLFDEDQVVLTPEWKRQRVAIPGPYRRLATCRLSDLDLMLSKMMRYDPTDLADLAFIVESGRLAPSDVHDAIRRARVPDSEEIREQMALCRNWLVRQGLCVP